MPRRDAIEEALARATPADVERLLTRLGYSQVSERPALGRVFANPEGVELIVPTDPTKRDYPRVLRGLVEVLVDDHLRVGDVVALLFLPDSDLLRYTLDDAEFAIASVPMGYAVDALSAIISMLRYTARGVHSQREGHLRIAREPEAFGKGCRLGHTEHGSFILKVFCPTNPSSIQIPEGIQPFGRLVVRACIDNFRFLGREDSTDPSVPLPPALNQGVVDALGRLSPPSGFARCGIGARYVTRVPPEGNRTELDVSPLAFDRAKQIGHRLRRTTGIEEEVLTGYITDLHKDPPSKEPEGEVNHTISVDAKYGARQRKISLVLLPELYRKAVRWHDDNVQVHLRAVIDKRTTHWAVLNLKEFRSLEENQRRLF